ncbi:hypothetical protein TraAM80_07530 [Trypanosoma rangeli]|uniref:Uncharacterized protein n=1 Tax=Trypanosoma rangeli TaxID=5698 RepID=A0A422N4Y0_TRYRA|nr:uncharacterized protein TraAM80_07530 [Trypanosoma rangeli]RNF00529.1 hypothetical protein TraAM80_07530 [Trypanosoma rangeli]|eukprot:RNF00529.1 hypothetical protein TraAM80_07530 [Trypanosoma rangeli]
MPAFPVPQSEGSTEHEFDRAAGSPSPLPVEASSAVVRGESLPESSPRLMVRDAVDSRKHYTKDTNEQEESYSPASAAGLQISADDLQLRERAPLMPPPPSPGEGDRRAVLRSPLYTTASSETHMRELQLMIQKNYEQRSELATLQASLREAQQVAEAREVECVELHRLVDRLQAELNCLKLESSRRLARSDTQKSRKGNPRVNLSSPNVQSANGARESRLLRESESKTGQGMPLNRESSAIEARHSIHLKASIVSAVADASMNLSSNSTTLGEQTSLQQICEERDMLAKELARTKVVVAEQETILDRLGLHFPYPGAVIGAARRIIPTLELLRKKHTRRLQPLVLNSATHIGESERNYEPAEE